MLSILLVALPKFRIAFNLSGLFPLPELGLATLAAAVEAEGICALRCDLSACHSRELLEARIRHQPRADVIGLSVNLFNLRTLPIVLPLFRRYQPDALLVLGGPGVCFSARRLFDRLPSLDALVYGPGEEVLPSIVKGARRTGVSLPGVVFRGEDGPMMPPQPVDLEKTPQPALGWLPPGPYRMHPPFSRFGPVALLEASRGCPYECNFCSLPRQWQQKSVDRVVREVELARATQFPAEIHFVDPTFTQDPEWVRALCSRLASSGMRWSCKTRPDRVDYPLLEAMKQAGCYLVSYGVESGDDGILSALRKENCAEVTLEAFRASRRVGLSSLAYVLAGSPGETEESIVRTALHLLQLKPDYALFGELLPAPGSPLVRELEAQGQITEEEMLAFYLYGYSRRLAEQTLTGLPRADVRRHLRHLYARFYLRPGFVWRQVSTVQGWEGVSAILRTALMLVPDLLGGVDGHDVSAISGRPTSET